MSNVDEFLGSLAPSQEQMQDLNAECERAIALSREAESLEEALKATKAELNTVLGKRIPDLFASSGLTELKLKGGAKIALKDFVSGTLPKEDLPRIAAMHWLRENGAAGIIKTKVVAEFGVGQDNQASAAMMALEDLEVDYSAEEGVHPMTLGSFARERLKKGEEVPLDLLGLYAGQVAKITLPK